MDNFEHPYKHSFKSKYYIVLSFILELLVIYYFVLVKHPTCETSTPPYVILPELNDKESTLQ